MLLYVMLEVNGVLIKAGELIGTHWSNARFQYEREYMLIDGIRPISVSLPFQEEAFTSEKTKCFFEGLLPEGFSRKAVAAWIKVEEDDYITILSVLGKECLGAIQILNPEENIQEQKYEVLTLKEVQALAAEGATTSTKLLIETHLSLTGASGKVGLYYDEEEKQWYLPKGIAPSTHIVKQSHVRLKQIVINEQLCMETARGLGIEVPDSFIINTGAGLDQEILYATKRYDRVIKQEDTSNDNIPLRLHQEDFAQALGIPSREKYERENQFYIKKIFQLIRLASQNPMEDSIKLWDMILFHYLIGNNDGHIKNFSLLYSSDMKWIRLAPAYDLLSTYVYGGADQMSFYIGGEIRRSKIRRHHLEQAAKDAGIGVRFAMKRYSQMAKKIELSLHEASMKLQMLGFDTIEVENGIRQAIHSAVEGTNGND